MSDCSAPEIREAYEDVRNDNSETNWMAITYAEGSDKVWTLAGKGDNGLDGLKELFTPDFRGFAYLRVISGDELSKRAKFVLISFCGANIKQMARVKLTVHRADVCKVIEQVSVSLDANEPDEVTDDEIMARVKKAGGANYSKN